MNEGIARVLGFFFTGIGHIYKGYVTKGIILILLYAGACGLFVTQYSKFIAASEELSLVQIKRDNAEISLATATSELGKKLYSFELEDYSKKLSISENKTNQSKTALILSSGIVIALWGYSFLDICRLTSKSKDLSAKHKKVICPACLQEQQVSDGQQKRICNICGFEISTD